MLAFCTVNLKYLRMVYKRNVNLKYLRMIYKRYKWKPRLFISVI